MTPTESAEKLTQFAAASAIAIQSCAPREGLEQMFAFFEGVKADGCDGPEDDMLLYQWGIYDWGRGKFFELNITRQFIETAPEDDDAMSQLSLTFKFEPTPELAEIEAGNSWFDGRGDFSAFRDSVFASVPILATAKAKPTEIELAHWYV
jgi:hypothetical protein